MFLTVDVRPRLRHFIDEMTIKADLARIETARGVVREAKDLVAGIDDEISHQKGRIRQRQREIRSYYRQYKSARRGWRRAKAWTRYKSNKAWRKAEIGGRRATIAALKVSRAGAIEVLEVAEEALEVVEKTTELIPIEADPRMVALARTRLAARGSCVRLWVGDATAICAPDASYEAVFDFGIIHHVPRWRAVLDEVHRVLKPGGRFFAEEVLKDFILNPVIRRTLEHPLEDRFTHEMFIKALQNAGLEVVAERRLGRLVGWYIARK